MDRLDFQNELDRLLTQTKEAASLPATLLSDVSAYAAVRAAHLAAHTGEPGFSEMVRAEADNVALRLAVSTVDGARAADLRLTGIVQGALQLGALAIAASLGVPRAPIAPV